MSCEQPESPTVRSPVVCVSKGEKIVRNEGSVDTLEKALKLHKALLNDDGKKEHPKHNSSMMKPSFKQINKHTMQESSNAVNKKLQEETAQPSSSKAHNQRVSSLVIPKMKKRSSDTNASSKVKTQYAKYLKKAAESSIDNSKDESKKQHPITISEKCRLESPRYSSKESDCTKVKKMLSRQNHEAIPKEQTTETGKVTINGIKCDISSANYKKQRWYNKSTKVVDKVQDKKTVPKRVDDLARGDTTRKAKTSSSRVKDVSSGKNIVDIQ